MDRKELESILNGSNIDELTIIGEEVRFQNELVIITQKERGYFLNDVTKYLRIKQLVDHYGLIAFENASFSQIRFGMYIYTRLYNIPGDKANPYYHYLQYRDNILFGVNWNGYSKPNNMKNIEKRLADVNIDSLNIQDFLPTFWER